MKTSLKILLLFHFTLVSSFNLFAQHDVKDKIMNNVQEESYIITTDGNKIELENEYIEYNPDFIIYKDEKNKTKFIKAAKIKRVNYGGVIIMNLPTRFKEELKGRGSLQRIAAYNNDYILAICDNGSYPFFTVFDRNFKLIAEYKKFGFTGMVKINVQKERYKDNFIKYFKECEELNEAILKNIESKTHIGKGINNYNCNNSPDLEID